MGIRATNINNLGVLYPEIAEQWNYSKNGELTPFQFTAKSNKKVWWTCQTNSSHEWETTISSRTHKKGTGCPYCANKKVCIDNCLATLYPDIAKQWHPTKNGDLTPFNVIGGSHKYAWWLCEKGHEWNTKIETRTISRNNCPYCCSNKVCIDNCLATTNPKLASEWNYDKNKNLTPYDITEHSNKQVWWICSVNSCHEWKAKPNLRTSNDAGCPYCSGRYVSIETCLATVNPYIAKQWNHTKNSSLTPFDIMPKSGKKVWWICEHGHEWKTTPAKRSIGRGCPECSSKSNGEKRIREFLIKYNIKFIPEYTNNLCRHIHPLSFDFAILDDSDNLLLLIEYDGIQHFESVKHFGGEKALKQNKIRDEIKNTYCKDNNIHLVRIPYWDFNNIENILKEKLSKVILNG
jgi:hypothetical protein